MSGPFTITKADTILYFNSSRNLFMSLLDCSNTSLCHTYLNSSASLTPLSCASSAVCCMFRTGGSLTAYKIRARDGGCLAYISFVNLDRSEAVSRWPSPSMEIQWALSSKPLCNAQNDCDMNSMCKVDAVKDSTSAMRCYCNAGLTWDGVKGVCINKSTWKDPNGCEDQRRSLLVVIVQFVSIDA